MTTGHSQHTSLPFPLAAGLAALLAVSLPLAASAQGVYPEPPDHVVRLVFVHHSTGENWLADDYGGLGLALAEDNYFVSDTNYGWGPDAIGDRTDIPDWLEWFRGDRSDRYLEALYGESGQNSAYTRSLGDPGGENEIILFKSCFPNSNLEGSPDDPPASEGGYSVGGAKYVYNQLLDYFQTRPDRLFVVITAPPVRDPTYAANARAFNNWLVNDWLRENDYPLANVAVFDFYNILTGPENHHRIHNGEIEHAYAPGMDTAYYPSGADDDHPSIEGSRRATEEFVPLLNAFYNRWQAALPEGLPSAPLSSGSGAEPTTPASGTAGASSLLDDFESGPPSGTSGWEPNWDASTPTRVTCAAADDEAAGGGRALRVDFDVAAGSWATCALFYDGPQDWSLADGLTFLLRADTPGLPFDLDVYAGQPDAMESYVTGMEAPEDPEGWAAVTIAWSDLRRVDWEENAGELFVTPQRVLGVAFGLGAPEEASVSGTLWIDDIGLVGGEAGSDSPSDPVQEGDRNTGGAFPCLGSVTLPLALALWIRSRRLA